ncbi:MAG: glutamine-hydrolyzing carbamoyl-phosphate synthase small subunit [Bacteroidales bacterium]|jgi:carbamoyl-phosphate synthase small subunit|nr:glutamine-hydrolyzing carbamoyl-phosphate synthase small subunit [Bacteroidales bacterium]
MPKLILDDGTCFTGRGFGAQNSAAGEVVFNTAMTGYPESLTDPSYKGQILVLTYPLIGNYGVPGNVIKENLSRFFESDRIQISGLIVASYSARYSHWNALESLSDWLKEQGIPGLCDVDTRMITKLLRERGTMMGKLVQNDDSEIEFYDPNKENLVAQVSIHERVIYDIFSPGMEEKGPTIVLIDCGVKNNIIRCMVSLGATIIRVPWDYDFLQEKYDGLVISNGPGDPQQCKTTIRNLKRALQKENPIFGICLGNQLLALAGGATTYKLKYGHRGYNQPVLRVGTERAYVTSQNHGYAVDSRTLGQDWEPLFVNLNDQTNEGLKHKFKPFFSTQFHPEASGGPTDTRFLFDDFMNLVRDFKIGKWR